MDKRLGLMIVAIVGLGLFWWFTRLAEDPPPEVAATPSPSSNAPTGHAVGGAAHDGPDEPATATLAGRVVDSTGKAIGGAVVTLAGYTQDAESSPNTATTDDAGQFEIADLKAGDYAVSATAAGYLPSVRTGLALGVDEPQSVTLTLEPGGNRLHGTVSDMTGGTVDGALVRVTPLKGFADLALRRSFGTLSAEDGNYSVQVPSGRFRVEVTHPEYAKQARTIEVGDGPRAHDFALVPTGVIEGVVLAEADRKPVPGALVQYWREERLPMPDGEHVSFPGAFGSTKADDQGRFRIGGLEPGLIQLVGRAKNLAGTEPLAVPLAIAEHKSDVELYVAAAHNVSGRVVVKGDAEKGVAGANVSIAAGERTAGAPTDTNGYFRLEGVAPGPHELLATARGFMSRFSGTTVDVRGDVEGVVLELDPGLAIRGRVEPAEEAEVSLELRPEFGSMTAGMTVALGGGRTQADADDGSFELRPVSSGPATVVARTPDGRSGEASVAVGPGGADDVVIRLESRATLNGRVVDSRGNPVAEALVNLRTDADSNAKFSLTINGREQGGMSGSTADDGRFEIPGLKAGSYTIRVSNRYGESLTLTGPTTVDIAKGASSAEALLTVESLDGEIRGVVVSADGEPVPDAWVALASVAAMERPEERDPSEDGKATSRTEMQMIVADGATPMGRRPPVLTDDSGQFVFTQLRDTTYEVSAEAGGGSRRTSKQVKPDATVRLELAPMGAIEGTVEVNGKRVKEFGVVVDGPTDRSKRVRSTDGQFEVDRLEPGAYTVQVHTPEGTGSAKVTVAPGKTAQASIVLEQLARVSGRIVGDDGKPVVGARIVFGDGGGGAGGRSLSITDSGEGITTDAEGRFEASVGGGRRILVALHPETHQPVAFKPVVVEPGQKLDLGDVSGQDFAGLATSAKSSAG